MKYITYFTMTIVVMFFVGCTNSNTVPERTSGKHWSWLDKSQPVELLTADGDIMRKNYYIVLDGSGSMSGNRMVIAKQAITAFTQKIQTDDSIGLVVFDDRGTSQRVALQSDNILIFKTAVNNVVAGGGTPLRSAISLAYRNIQLQAYKQKGFGEYHIIIVTDGAASMSEDPTNIVNTISIDSPVEIHTIGFQIAGDHSLNQPGVTQYYSADDYTGIMSSFTQILAESDTFDVVAF